MDNCTGCFNGCTQIVSDQCVKYTGSNITFLGIENGMPLSEIEEKLTDYLTTVLDGSGIIPTLPDPICSLVSSYLPISGDITLVHVISALISSACDLQTQVDDVSSDVATIEANYTIASCLSGVTPSSGTHNILQAVITELCSVSSAVTALQNALTSYVKISDVNTYIADYITANVTSSKMYLKMVPYVAVEYYGNISNFSADGTGIGDWEQVYLCNGLHGTPDKRGVFPVGITNMGGSYGGSVTYNAGDTGGANTVTLSTAQMPAHTHAVTVTPNESPHFHYMFNTDVVSVSSNIASTNYPAQEGKPGGNRDYDIMGTASIPTLGKTSSTTTGLTLSTSVTYTGLGGSHENRPPYLACYYIMHIPD